MLPRAKSLLLLLLGGTLAIGINSMAILVIGIRAPVCTIVTTWERWALLQSHLTWEFGLLLNARPLWGTSIRQVPQHVVECGVAGCYRRAGQRGLRWFEIHPSRDGVGRWGHSLGGACRENECPRDRI